MRSLYLQVFGPHEVDVVPVGENVQPLVLDFFRLMNPLLIEPILGYLTFSILSR